MFTNEIAGEPRPAGYDAETIYNWFHDSEGPQPILSASETILRQIVTGHAEVNAMIKRVIEDSRAVWDGRAADAARGGIGPMGTWADQITDGATSAQGQVAAARDAFHRAKNSVEPPLRQPDPRQVTIEFTPFGGMDPTKFVKAVEKWQANQSHNVHVLESYGTSTNTAVRALPEFVLPEGVGGEVKPPAPPSPDPGGPPIGPPSDPGGRGPRGGNLDESGPGVTNGSGQRGESENAAFAPQPGQHGQAGPAPWRPEPGNQGTPDQSGFTGAIGGLGAFGGGLAVGGGVGAGGWGGGDSREKPGQGGRGAPGENNRGTTGTSSTTRGGGKPTATPLAGPLPGPTGKAEDEERQRPSWLVEVDDVFTNDMQRVAPPVIGEDPGD
ncbi:hypothetical protein NLX83_26200 [Allokutzneria sp. A3M-2-11 16]|uniref:hypothetical protein n=1 Tax=Allokutzneria sp. A3M-2-11 16 TaxID=2962043 RepID=UPI0020B6A085|nr:hypothetical protein [Allokutzneria sp. A3M-2-11 16]MCP3802771.1 hypothetical protein [Allokutzneria sp. A3M-2-11 16]